MALILCVGNDPEAMRVRQRFLERNGHRVSMAFNGRELATACESSQFDIVIIGKTLGPQMKQHVVHLIRQYCRNVKVLELYTVSTARAIEDADSWIEVDTELQEEIARRVAELMKAA